MVFYIILLSGLGTLGYFGADMYLPTLPALEAYFSSNKTAIGLTFSIYMFGITIGQLLYGTLSDCYGRKNTLIFGLGLFIIATIGCIYSTDIISFIFWRLIQALGACASMVIWQAMVIDKFETDDIRKIFAIVFPMLALSPALAPTIGGAIITLYPWQAIFIVLALVGVILLSCVIFFIKETMHRDAQTLELKAQDIKNKYLTLLRSPIYMGYVCTIGMTSGAYFCYLTASPFILSKMGYSAMYIGLSYVPQTVAFMCGGFISKKLIDYFGPKTMTYCLYAFVFFALVLFCMTVLFPLKNALQIIIPFSIMALINGILYPYFMSMALNYFPQLAGTAAGLAGSIQAFIAFTSTSILAMLLFLGVVSMSVTIVLMAITGLLFFKFSQTMK
ncbi:MAG: Bcr/CflA family efflux MFS transporter [Legionellales bacterium]|jgi:Bcr/CflA subfamily drug resistance transporter